MIGKTQIKSFKDLIGWQKAFALVQAVYEITSHFPSGERYGLVSQMRRAAVSIASNIAEGHARKSTREFVQFISTAEGSAAELETQLLLSGTLNFCPQAGAKSLLSGLEEVQKMLGALRRQLAARC